MIIPVAISYHILIATRNFFTESKNIVCILSQHCEGLTHCGIIEIITIEASFIISIITPAVITGICYLKKWCNRIITRTNNIIYTLSHFLFYASINSNGPFYVSINSNSKT